MALQRADPLADELALDWGEDTIYCEATCDPNDVLYEGSEDEDYDSPASRKIRYEAAGQRFLSGKTPFIMTAVLKGPFEPTCTNWVNPWRSKQRTAGASVRTRTSPGKLARSAKVQRNISIPETIRPPPGSLECHLPSPESLNQTSETDTHPYLEDDELVKVQQWRDTVKSEKEQGDELWTSTAQTSTSERKRKANGSSWLKHLASKRRRADIMESGSIDTPVRHKPQHPVSTAKTMNVSVTSAPDHSPSSVASVERCSLQSHEEPHVSEDELSHDEVMSDHPSAHSSSPLSQLQYTPVLDPEVSFLSQGTPEQQTPSKAPVPKQRLIPDGSPAKPQSAVTNNGATVPDFETQEDESFCFKMRPRLDQTTKVVSDEDESMVEDNEDSWSGLSSPDQYMDSIASVSDLKDDVPADGLMNSQPSSNERPGEIELPVESMHNTAEVASMSSSLTESSTSDSELSSGSHPNSTTVVASEPVDQHKQDGRTQDVDMQDAAKEENSAAIAEHHDDSETESGDESDEEEEEGEDGGSGGTVKEDALEIKSPSITSDNNTPHISTVQEEAETTTLQPTPLGPDDGSLLSATANPPQPTGSSEDAHLPDPVLDVAINREGKEGLCSTHSTPKTTNSRRGSNSSQPWNHDTSPTILNTPVHEYTKQQADQSVSKETAPVPFSQQSPWAENKPSQYAATLSLGPLSTKDPESKQTGTDVAAILVSPSKQSPWADKVAGLPVNSLQCTPISGKTDRQLLLESSTPVVGAGVDARTQKEHIAATPVTALTPEPQFSVKSFASFRSSSPERSSQKAKRAVWRKSGSGLPSTQAILVSATKNPWESNSSERRVSFAPLPSWRNPESSVLTTPTPSLTRRQGSPPPDTPVSELPTSEGSKFQKHFNAVSQGPIIRRAQRLLPSESQLTAGSPLPDAMADAFLTADQLRHAALADPVKSDRETDESQDPFDMVADIMLEEFDGVGSMNIATQSPILTQGHQSPW
ncbi:protamine p1 [Fusarium longipes]|uniref:Protamine p1 n=1 Tax=Fusarium longipes TaxID=694270 RepID=A0A395T1Q4_9HYPO|nr:protamine p1 [Fusarium longipes]